MKLPTYSEYKFHDAAESHMHRRFMPVLHSMCGLLQPKLRVLDVGCGNGFTCNEFLERGCTVCGIDMSESGIAEARAAYPQARFEVLAADAEMLENLQEEPFDLVVSTEVVEHLYAPREFACGCFKALKPGGRFICTTPYHGYAKNLVLSLLGKWDAHANPLWDSGHIKLWSRRTLTKLLAEAGFENIRCRGVGRVPYLWMTMVLSADRPLT